MKLFIKILLIIIATQSVFASNEIQNIKTLNKQIESLEQEVIPLKSEILSLSGQILSLDNVIRQKENHKILLNEKIDSLQKKIISESEDSYEIEIVKDVEKNKVKREALNVFRQENKKSFLENISFIKKILDFFSFKSQTNISKEIIENESKYTLASLSNKQIDQEDKIRWANQKKIEIVNAKNKIKEDEKEIFQIKQSKTILLENIKNKENYFEEKILENKRKILSSLEQIKFAHKNNQFYQKKIQEKEIILENKNSNDPYDISRFEDNWPEFIWPVDPKRWITAFFKDKQYEDTFWFEHLWLDIRAAQNTEVKAVANAFVLKVEENWSEYSFVILVHKWDIQTVYGHLSKINVKEWSVILKWDIVWLSWGTPWTYGAWLITSWPHLHFELHKKWEPVDPKSYLPEL